ncbi:MAG: TRAP transporter substrate-binding protein DctP [Rhizobiaceae bacterium]|nr:TRAP transporter substrate-binding protein DctP [Rhizobiaceae bacterium]
MFRESMISTLAGAVALTVGTFATSTAAQADKITLHGAVQFDEKYAFTRLMRKFEQLTKFYYSGPHETEFILHKNSELGLEKDYVAYMNQGLSVDYAIASPSHMSKFSKLATVLDPPMLYRDPGHWSKVLASDVLKPVVDDNYKRADILLLGYGGGGIRHLIVNKPVSNMAEIKNVPLRVMGAPIQTKLFNVFGMTPNVIAYSEVYDTIQTGVIDAAENEAAEKLITVVFTERDKLIEAAIPVLKQYFKDVGATDLYDVIQAIK